MRFVIPSNLDGLAGYIEPFMALTGRSRWIKRLDGLSAEKNRSPYRWKIVADYHWLEMAIGFQAEILTIHGRLRPELVDPLTFTSLQFAASAVEVHRRLSSKGRTVLEGRLRDALKAETGFAALYLELDLAQRVMDAGGDVAFTDLEGEAVFDYLIRQGDLVAEVECKSLSADAGRSIHRKDFYRFVDALEHALARRRIARQREILLITLEGRLSPATAQQTRLLGAAVRALEAADAETIVEPGFQIQRQPITRSPRITVSGTKPPSTTPASGYMATICTLPEPSRRMADA